MIPVKDLAKYDKLQMHDEEDMGMDAGTAEVEGEFGVASQAAAKLQHRQMTLTYVVFFAEA